MTLSIRSRVLSFPPTMAFILVPLLAVTAAARPVDPLPGEAYAVTSAKPSAGITLSSGLIPADTTYFGGTVWAADSARWEAIEGGTWTFESGIGSHFQHPPESAKDPSFHAQMEGWTGLDLSAPTLQRFRRLGEQDFTNDGAAPCVGDAAGLGGDYSFWAGLLPHETDSLCYATGLGYGNNWNICIEREFTYAGTGSVTLQYDYAIDTEPGWDYVYVRVDTTSLGDEVVIATYDGPSAGTANHALVPGASLRSDPGPFTIRFCMESDGAYSDEDGLYPTSCGPLALDDISVQGGGIAYQTDFETDAGGWVLAPPAPAPGGEWSRLMSVADLPAIPGGLIPCDLGDSVLVMFDPATDGHPLYQDEVVLSPWIDLKEAGKVGHSERVMELGGYYDLALVNYVFVRIAAQWYPDTCAASGRVSLSNLTSTYSVFGLGGAPVCYAQPSLRRIDLTEVIPDHAEQVRLAVGAVSYCRYYGNCTGQSNTTPWFDSIRLSVRSTPSAIQDALDAAANGDTVSVPAGTWFGPGNRDLDFKGKNLVLIAPAGPQSTIIDCQGAGRGFLFQSGEDSTSVVDGFTILNGHAGYYSTGTELQHGGGLYIIGTAAPAIRNCVIRNCTGNFGGGAFIDDYAAPAFRFCVIESCEAQNDGGGICVRGYRDDLDFYECEIRGNHAPWGGGFYGSGNIDHCTIEGNTGGDGAGLYMWGGVVASCVISGNTAHSNGGGVRGGVGQWGCTSGTVLRDCQLIGNTAYSGGGCGDCMSLENCFVADNTAVHGGGVAYYYGGHHVEDCTIINNTAEEGGGLSLEGDSQPFSVRRCEVRGNTATSGGGIWMIGSYGDPPLDGIVDCVIAGNVASRGGGIAASRTYPTWGPNKNRVVSTSITGNRAGHGGGIYFEYPDSLFLSECILWENAADTSGAQIAFGDTSGYVGFTCSAVDSSGVSGPGTVAYDGAQVFEYPMFCLPEPASFAPTIDGDYHLAGNSPCLPTNSPCDSLIGALGAGCGALAVPDDDPHRQMTPLLAAWPNPASRALTLQYAVPPGEPVTVEIFDVRGRLVRAFRPTASEGQLSWDGRDDAGRPAASGIYLFRLVSPSTRLTTKAVLVR